MLLNPEKYRLIRALRPFSYSVALVTCGLGVALAYEQGRGNLLRAVLVMMAGVLLQAASNLANDHADLALWRHRYDTQSAQAVKQIKRNFLLAGICALIASAMGLVLVWQVGWPLLVLGVFGVLGGYFYTGEPVNYKQRGLGVPAVFLLTGVLMVSGTYYGVSGVWSYWIGLISIPVSLLASALLLANEIRDYNEDLDHNIQTLTVRMGLSASKKLYVAVVISVFPVSLLLYGLDAIHSPCWLLPPLLFVPRPLTLLNPRCKNKAAKQLPPVTGRFFMVFGICFILAVL